MDEIAIRKGHQYLTVVTGMDSSAIVSGHFHVIKLLNDHLSNLRRDI
jgi:hypothetical protein